jgi:uncharacterized Zn-binding protein involved in type VI secretion
MAAVQRIGDANTAGGVVTGGIASVRINGRPVAVTGNRVSPHPNCGARRAPPTHCHAVTTGGSSTVTAGGIRIQRTGDVDSCGHARAGGSADVTVG